MAKSIHHTYFFPQSPEVVWEYLTTAELIGEWLMKNDFMPIVGYQFHFWSNPAPQIGFDGNVYCMVLEVVPNKKLSYSWKCGPGDGVITIDSIVNWELHAKETGTELVLNHTGFKELKPELMAIYNAMEAGWLKHIKTMAENINAAQHGTTNA